MKDEIGDRMKSYYEDRTRIFLPRRTYTIIRVDGKSFHTYTKGLTQPFDDGLIEDMDKTACYLCKNIQGAKFAFVQSDEISILLTDFDKIGTDAWFDGNIQKMVSVAASMATAKFNQLRLLRILSLYEDARNFAHDFANQATLKVNPFKVAEFDARIFTIPCDYEVENYFIWRQKDATKNSISSVALSLYSHNELEGKNGDQKQEMIFQKGINWNDYAPKLKRGRFIQKRPFAVEADEDNPNSKFVMRNCWTSTECPIFTQDREFLLKYIPKNN
jgi:tRNA(His) 5'-end guanylyltransferase